MGSVSKGRQVRRSLFGKEMTAKTILLIDDDDGVREIVQFSLETATDWEVLTASSGKEGLAIAARELPDAILLDFMMPEFDGVATFGRLSANSLTCNIPTILLTAEVKDRKRFIDLGVIGVITKPFNALDLIEQVRSILGWDC